MATLRFPLLALASLTLAPVSFAGTPAQVTFLEQNGHLACDNTGTCRMVAFGPPATLMLGVLIERAAGPDTPVTARLSLADGSDGAPRSPRVHPEGRLRLHVDGADLGDIGPVDALEAGLVLAPPHAQALLDALGRGRPVRMTDTACQAWPLAESGNAALLLKMDEVQGRLHTPGALVGKGLRPESQVPVARVAPRLVPPPLLVEAHDEDAALAERDDLLQALLPRAEAGAGCAAASSRHVRIERIDATHVLAMLNCTTGRYIRPAGSWVIRDRPPFTPVPITASTLFPLYPHAVFLEEGLASPTDRCGTDRHWAWDGARLVLAATFVGWHCLGAGQRHWLLPTYVTESR